ncbi:hypothetical protein GFL03_22520 [Pseudomonas stutzeri]|uniref:hypothetical protein n=1 Tax=Stutzerimonas frequens TaxID=2968969 RepID=UPI001909D45F|nr:hypothetical protein [Stutzerimonas frequens]MBK3920051.1 hypothetical protein [Stutzerimonas frequens]
MTTSTHCARSIRLGSREMSRNQFLLVLVGLAGIAWAIAAFLGTPSDGTASVPNSSLSPHMVWAYLLAGIAVFGFTCLKRAGEAGTAYQCLLVAGGFLAGAAIKTFLA